MLHNITRNKEQRGEAENTHAEKETEKVGTWNPLIRFCTLSTSFYPPFLCDAVPTGAEKIEPNLKDPLEMGKTLQASP